MLSRGDGVIDGREDGRNNGQGGGQIKGRDNGLIHGNRGNAEGWPTQWARCPILPNPWPRERTKEAEAMEDEEAMEDGNDVMEDGGG